MKNLHDTLILSSARRFAMAAVVLMIGIAGGRSFAAPATILFQDEFDQGVPGWTAVQPPGNYIAGPMRWVYNAVEDYWVENSNIYTDAAGGAASATAVMLVNDAEAPDAFTYKARLLAGDDDGFGLIFGFQDELNFYRISFARQANRTLFPYTGWNVDRKVDGVSQNLFGAGVEQQTTPWVLSDNVPFDVTVSVNAENRLTLRVVEDPEGAAQELLLVDNQPLPGPAGGKVGLMSWGMSGSPPPMSFQAMNLDLDPVDLVGFPATTVLSDWTAVVPPRGDGTAELGSGHRRPLWGLGLGADGSHGVLFEMGDTFGGNDAAGQIDFVAGSLVAGDTNWTDYLVSTRITVADDDGFGILLRYQDELNFYRIALRRQNSSSGVRRGLSVQKVVNGVWEQAYPTASTPAEEPTSFIPANNVPFDLLAAIDGNELRITIIRDPENAAEAFAFPPIQITGLTHGKVGVFSWAMSRIEFDHVRVYSLEGVPLIVASPVEAVDPAPGVHSFAAGTSVTASANSPFEPAPGVRRVVSGWTGIGSVPATGDGSSVTFTLNDLSILTWNWETEYLLDVSASAGGSVEPAGQIWVREGTQTNITATAESGFVFLGWSGTSISSSSDLSLVANQPATLTALFGADSDNDSLPDEWERTFFGDLNASPEMDADEDDRSNVVEFQRGTDPLFAEEVVVADGLDSKFINVQRDPVLPGRWGVVEFGPGYKGAWEDSNDFRWATDGTVIGVSNVVGQVSFQGPRLIVRTNFWDPAWSNFTAQAVFTVGDNDGNNLYFRYQDELNWYRITITGSGDGGGDLRPSLGISVQKRVEGVYSEILRSEAIFTDPDDSTIIENGSGWKRVRVLLDANDADFQVAVQGWNVFLTPPDWDLQLAVTNTFTDASLAHGRIGFGSWGQGGGEPQGTTQIPVTSGVLVDDIIVESGGQVVFSEDWESARVMDDLPDGWTDPATGSALAGDWRVSAHGSIMQLSNIGAVGEDPEGPILLAPPPGVANYVLQLGFHPFDNDGIGFVYDFADSDNYARVMFVSEATGPGRIPQGLNVSRKVNGVWTDIVLGESSFIYRPGHPFAVEFANNNGQFRLSAWEIDNPEEVAQWSWTGDVSAQDSRFGLATWGEEDAHFIYARALSLRERQAPPGQLEIVGVTLSATEITLEVENPGDAPYDVEMTTSLSAPDWTAVAQNQTGATWTGSRPASTQAFFRLRRSEQ